MTGVTKNDETGGDLKKKTENSENEPSSGPPMPQPKGIGVSKPVIQEVKAEVNDDTAYLGQGSLTPADSSEDESDDKIESSARSRSPSASSSASSSSLPSRSTPASNMRSCMPNAQTATDLVINFLTIVVSVAVFGVFLVGSYDYFKNVEDNKCAMTWMYQPPRYVPLQIGNGVDEKFPMYHLYVYTEGDRNFETMSKDTYKFTGIPVLYIPGNAGSYQQVRSLASVALWKYLDAGTPFHFDFFTLDLNEEFSALYGYSLQRQVEFAKQAVMKIVNLYEEFHRVVLVGHSMGGIIAKAVALDGNESGEGGNLANLIITLATPHSKPVILLDPEQDLFYYAISRNWTKVTSSSKSDSGNSHGLNLISIAGGERDYLVLPKLTRWNPFTSIHTMTTGVPGVWASADHLCIVWCKQLVLTLVRVLYDLVEFHQRNKYFFITDSQEKRLPTLKYHLVERSSGKSYYGSDEDSKRFLTLAKNIEQVEVTAGMYCVPSSQRPTYLRVPMSFLKQNATGDDGQFVILSTNIKDKNWLMGCTEESQGLCTQAESLTQHGKIIPHLRRRRKMATLALSSLTGKYSSLIVKMEPYQFRTCVMLETYSEKERRVPLGGELKAENKIFYNLTWSIPKYESFISSMVAWKVKAQSVGSCPESHNLLAQFNHGNFQQSRFLKNESIILRVTDFNVSESWLALYLEPTCSYKITTSIAFLETSGQIFRALARFLPSFYASIVLMTLYFQKDSTNWSSFHLLLLGNAYHLAVLPGFIVTFLLQFIPTDWPLMVEEREYSVVVPILCYMIAYCLVLAVSSATWYAIITGGTAIHAVVIRVLSSRFGSWVPRLFSNHRGFTSVTEHVTEAAFELTLTRFPMTIGVILLGLSFATCGSLGITAAFAVYLVKLFKIYEDLLEDLLKAKIGNVRDSLSPMNFHFCCFMLWFVLVVLNIPSLLHWTRSTFTTQPEWDLSMYLCLLLLPTVAVLWQEFVPQIESTIWNIHRYVFYGVGLASVLWGTHRLYVTSFLITFVFLTMALCQLISVMMTSLQAPPPQPTPQTADSTRSDNPPESNVQ